VIPVMENIVSECAPVANQSFTCSVASASFGRHRYGGRNSFGQNLVRSVPNTWIVSSIKSCSGMARIGYLFRTHQFCLNIRRGQFQNFDAGVSEQVPFRKRERGGGLPWWRCMPP
jgi:hypothetical protein